MDHGDAIKSPGGADETGWDAPLPSDHIHRQYATAQRIDETSGDWSHHGQEDVRAAPQSHNQCAYPPSLLSLRTNYEPDASILSQHHQRQPLQQQQPPHHGTTSAVGYWDRSSSPYENNSLLHQPPPTTVTATRPPEQPQFRMLRRNDEKSAEYFAHHAGAPHHPRQVLDAGDEQRHIGSDEGYPAPAYLRNSSSGGSVTVVRPHGEAPVQPHHSHRECRSERPLPQQHRAEAKSPPLADNIWEKRMEQRQLSVESSEGVVSHGQPQPFPSTRRGHHPSPPGRHRPQNFPSLTESLDAPMLPLSEQMSRSETARRSYRGGGAGALQYAEPQDVRFEQQAPRGADNSKQKLWNTPSEFPIPNGDEGWDKDSIVDREGAHKGERRGPHSTQHKQRTYDGECPAVRLSSKRGGVESAVSMESDRYGGGKLQRRGARQEDTGDRAQHDKFSNMGEFHAEDYGIDSGRHKSSVGRGGAGLQQDHADRRAGNRRGEDGDANKLTRRQGLPRRRSSVEGHHQAADKTTTTSHQSQQRKPKSYEAGDEGAPRGRPIAGKSASALATRQQSAYVARCLKGGPSTESKVVVAAAAVTLSSSKHSSKRVPHMKSPVISDGAGDEWETASETSQQQPDDDSGYAKGRVVEKAQSRLRNDIGQVRGAVGKETSRRGDMKAPNKQKAGSGSYLAMRLAEREEKERRERETTAAVKGKPKAAATKPSLDTTETGRGNERHPTDEAQSGQEPVAVGAKSGQPSTHSKNAMPARPSIYHVNADYERRKRGRNEKGAGKSRQRRSSTEPPPATISTTINATSKHERNEAVVSANRKGELKDNFLKSVRRPEQQQGNTSSQQRAGSRRNAPAANSKSTCRRRDGLAGSHHRNTASSLDREKSSESSNNSEEVKTQKARLQSTTQHALLSESFSVEGDFEEVLSKRAKRLRQQQMEEERRREQKEKERLEKLRAKRANAIPLSKCQPLIALQHPTAEAEKGTEVSDKEAKQVRELREPLSERFSPPQSPPSPASSLDQNAWAGVRTHRHSSSEDQPYVPPATVVIPSPIARPTPKLVDAPPRPVVEKRSDESEEHAQLQKKLDQVKDVWSRPIAMEPSPIACPHATMVNESAPPSAAGALQTNVARANVQPLRVQQQPNPVVVNSPPVISSAAFMVQRQGSTPTSTYSTSSTPLHLATNNLGGFVPMQSSQGHNNFFGATLNYFAMANNHPPSSNSLTQPPPPIGHPIIKSPTSTTIDAVAKHHPVGGMQSFPNGVMGGGMENPFVHRNYQPPHPPPLSMTPSWLSGNGSAAMAFPELMMSTTAGGRMNPSPMAHVGIYSTTIAPPLHLPPPSMMSCPPPAHSTHPLEQPFWQRQATATGLGPIGAPLPAMDYRSAPPPTIPQYNHHNPSTMRVNAQENSCARGNPGAAPQLRQHLAKVEGVGRRDTTRAVEEAAN